MVAPPPVGRIATTEEERRRNRMASNRLSARRSRAKRQQYIADVTSLVAQLQRENDAMRSHVSRALQQCHLFEQENRTLAAHARELCGRLLLRNSQLRLLGAVAGVPLDVPEIPDHLLQQFGLQPPSPPQFQVLCQPDMDALAMLEF